jgi:hypothetical protein
VSNSSAKSLQLNGRKRFAIRNAWLFWRESLPSASLKSRAKCGCTRGAKQNLLSSDRCRAFSRNNEKPLVRSAMIVVGSAFFAPNPNHHRRRLRPFVSREDGKSFPKS